MVAPITSTVGENSESPVSAPDGEHPDSAGAARLMAALSPQQRLALDSMLEGLSVKAAADSAQVHRGTVDRWNQNDANFIAARNARVLQMMLHHNAKMLAMIPASLLTIQEDIENGDSRLAMQFLKLVLQATKSQQPLLTSAQAVTDQMKAADQQQQLDRQNKQIDLDVQAEATIARQKEVALVRHSRMRDEKPFLQRYEDTQRFYHTTLAEAPITKARMAEIDARVAAEVRRTVNGIMNPAASPGAAATVAPSRAAAAVAPAPTQSPTQPEASAAPTTPAAEANAGSVNEDASST